MKGEFFIVILLLVYLSSGVQGEIFGWGRNDYGQLGLGTAQDPIFDVTVISFYDSYVVRNISLGSQAHFASVGNGVYSCGSNSNGQLGLGTQTAPISTPQLMPNFAGVFDVFSLPLSAIAYDSTQKTIFGWGFAAGFVKGVLLNAGTVSYPKVQSLLSSYEIAGKIEKVATANGACFVLLTNGTVFAAGYGTNGRLGMGSNDTSSVYQQVHFWDSLQFFRIFSSQSPFVCGQTVDRGLYCWGSNSVGQLGLGHTNDVFLPTRVAFFDTNELIVSQLEQGIEHSIALTCGGRVFVWGANERGQLGLGNSSLDIYSSPIEIPFNETIVEIAAGAYHNFARTVSNKWFVWGMGDSGVLGLGNISDVLLPTLNQRFMDLAITHIESGSYSFFAMGWHSDTYPTAPPDCPSGWEVNECLSADIPCGPNMVCIDTERAFWCVCATGFELSGDPNGDQCVDINECLQVPCVLEATCVNTNGSFHCDCPTGFVGDGLPQGNSCVPIVCGNGIVEPGEECDWLESPSCCNSLCQLEPVGFICRPSTVPCDKNETCDGSPNCPADDWGVDKYCDYCGNGECNNITETCTTCSLDCGTCDSCATILCAGKCVTSAIDCKVTCPAITDFVCRNYTCVSDYALCATHNCSQLECWDGGCVADLSLCPPIPACPVLTKRCAGKCINFNEACDVLVETNCTRVTDRICMDGKCASSCEEFNGCSTGQIWCPSGVCDGNINVCQGNCSTNYYICADGSCRLPDDPCPLQLRFEAAIPFSQKIQPGANTTLSVVSQNGIPIVDLSLPKGTFTTNVTLSVAPVSFSFLKGIALPAGWNGSSLDSNLFSSAVAFEVNNDATFSQNVTISFSASLPPNVNISEVCLGFINASKLWECASDIIEINGTFYGKTGHFTPFAVIKQIKAPVINTLSRDDLQVFSKITDGSVIVYVYCGLFLTFSVLYIWAFHADSESIKQKRKDKGIDMDSMRHANVRYEYEEEKRTPQMTRKLPPTPALIRSTSNSIISSSSAPPSEPPSAHGTLSKAPPMLANSPSPSGLSSPVSSAPSTLSKASPALSQLMDSNFPASVDAEVALSMNEELAPESSRKRLRRRTLVMKEAAAQRFTTKHKWLSIYFTARIENLPRVARVTILLCMILTNMTVASLFYNSANRSTAGQRILVGVISSGIAFVCSFAIFTMFKLVNKVYRPVCYAVSAVYIAGTGFLTLWYNLKLEQSTQYGWCVSASIGIIQDAFFNEPVKIVVISLLIAFCPFLPFVKKL